MFIACGWNCHVLAPRDRPRPGWTNTGPGPWTHFCSIMEYGKWQYSNVKRYQCQSTAPYICYVYAKYRTRIRSIDMFNKWFHITTFWRHVNSSIRLDQTWDALDPRGLDPREGTPSMLDDTHVLPFWHTFFSPSEPWTRSFWILFLIHQHQNYLFGYQSFQNLIFLVPNSILPRSLGSNFL